MKPVMTGDMKPLAGVYAPWPHYLPDGALGDLIRQACSSCDEGILARCGREFISHWFELSLQDCTMQVWHYS